jgi:zinc metalloprotease ZmpB
VIRWAFEKQGAFRTIGAPVTDEGAPPDVDVYIDDGRQGEYAYLANHWSCTDIWNRRSVGDGGGVHEEPVVGVTNYAYVRIKNRGTQEATDVVVRGFHCLPGIGLTYPDDWEAMTTTQRVAPNLAAGDAIGVVVGAVRVGAFAGRPRVHVLQRLRK